MKEGENLKLIKLDPSQHFTKPPARYSEASLVKELEKRGIGRPSTYAAIISTIQERGYVTTHNRRFYAERRWATSSPIGSTRASPTRGLRFHRRMGASRRRGLAGERDWKHLLDEFYGDFKKKLEVAEVSEKGMRAYQPTPDQHSLPRVRPADDDSYRLHRRVPRLPGYSLPPKERCKATVNLIPGDDRRGRRGRVRVGVFTASSCPIWSVPRWTPTR